MLITSYWVVDLTRLHLMTVDFACCAPGFGNVFMYHPHIVWVCCFCCCWLCCGVRRLFSISVLPELVATKGFVLSKRTVSGIYPMSVQHLAGYQAMQSPISNSRWGGRMACWAGVPVCRCLTSSRATSRVTRAGNSFRCLFTLSCY